MKQLLLLAAVICFGIAAIKWYTSRMTPNSSAAKAKPEKKDLGYRVLSPEEAKARMDANQDLILLDVRTQPEYDDGHIPGAVCLPLIGTRRFWSTATIPTTAARRPRKN